VQKRKENPPEEQQTSRSEECYVFSIKTGAHEAFGTVAQ
jgi:hypothetical protein